MNARHLLAFGLVLVLLQSGLAAQTADKTGVSIRFRALAFDDPILGANYLEGEALRRIDIPNNAFTHEIKYQGANTLRFITIDEETLNPKPLSPEISAATQRNPYPEAERAPAAAHVFIVNPLTGRGFDSLFTTHPNIENRILQLQQLSAEWRQAAAGQAPRPLDIAMDTPQTQQGPWSTAANDQAHPRGPWS